MAFVEAARIEEIPAESGLRVQIGEIAIGLYRVDGEIYAMEDACPHAGFPLSAGRLEGCVIVCEAHGWPFDVRTGFAPENADGFPIPCFAVRVEAGRVLVDLETRLDRLRRPGRAPRPSPSDAAEAEDAER
ncbi:MAG: Rieske (2Fe-2S) protein [bacterium]